MRMYWAILRFGSGRDPARDPIETSYRALHGICLSKPVPCAGRGVLTTILPTFNET
jgi:hypothetical protein